jgi:catechol 2,3-dioxygenase-like lactoylglutathione lyase family enzyme
VELSFLPIVRLALPLLAIVASGLQVAAQAPSQGVTRPLVRFHHLHYRVPEPAAHFRRTAENLKGSRAIVQGVGVGIRVGREYVLFDRTDSIPASQISRSRKPSDAYAEAARWLASRGAVVHPRTLGDTLVIDALPNEMLDHVGFAVDDLAATLATFKDKPVAATEDAAKFRLRSGLIVEIVRDTDRPDAYWCPMHPDVRSPGEGRCPLCGMALVSIPPPRIGEYRLDAAMKLRLPSGSSGIRLVVKDPDSGEPVAKFLEVHERPFHLFIIGRDLEYFEHAHPALMPDGTFELDKGFAPGVYTLIADFVPVGGTPQMVPRTVMTPFHSGSPFDRGLRLTTGPLEQIASGLRVKLVTPAPVVRRETTLTFEVSDEESGKPVTDLEPYLGVSGHLLIVSEDLTTAVHGHPEGQQTAGPTVTFGVTLPLSGRYKLWVEFQRKGQVVTAPFVIEVPPE